MSHDPKNHAWTEEKLAQVERDRARLRATGPTEADRRAREIVLEEVYKAHTGLRFQPEQSWGDEPWEDDPA